MKSKNRIISTLVCSLLIFGVSTYRILTETLSSTPLFAAYALAIGGLIGIIGVIIEILRKSQQSN